MKDLIDFWTRYRVRRAFNALFTTVCNGVMCAVRPAGHFVARHIHKAVLAIEGLSIIARIFGS